MSDVYDVTTTSPTRRRTITGLPTARRVILEIASYHGQFDQVYNAVMRWTGSERSFGPVKVAHRRAAA